MTDSLGFVHRDAQSALKLRRRIGRAITAIVALLLVAIVAGTTAMAVGQLIGKLS